jgi:hypothetical protein
MVARTRFSRRVVGSGPYDHRTAYSGKQAAVTPSNIRE